MPVAKVLPRVAVAVSLVAFAAPGHHAAAQEEPFVIHPDYEGQGEGKLVLHFTFDTPTIGMLTGEIRVTTFGCDGTFTGSGHPNGTVLELRHADRWALPPADSKATPPPACVITITFDKTGKKASVSESDCAGNHGSSCSFNGVIKAKDKAKE